MFEESIFLRALVSGLLKDLLLISYDCLCRDYFYISLLLYHVLQMFHILAL